MMEWRRWLRRGVGALLTPIMVGAQTIRISPTPSVRIGASEQQSELLNAVAGATRLPSGQIVVGNRGDYALLVFDANGQLLKKLARKGKGPGEVEYLLWLHRCGDAMYTGDITGERVQEFGADLSFRRAFRFGGQTYRLACNAKGQFVHMGWDDHRGIQGGVYRPTSRYWLTPADSTPGTTLGTHPGSERFGTIGNTGKVTGTGPRVLGREPRVAIGPDAAYIALADSLSVLAFDLSGAPRPALRAAFTPPATTAGDVDAEIERLVGSLGESMRRTMTASLREMPRPSTLPATRDLLVDATGLVWVQAYPSASQRTVTWTVFRANGTIAARVALPVSFEVFEIGRDYLLAQVINAATGVPEVHLYPVAR
jgi:hypothetical protein